MKFVLDKSQTFKKIIDSVKDLIPETIFECSFDEILVQAMDSSHVCLCKLSLKKNGFQEYSCPEDFIIGLSLLNLSKILKCSQNTDSLEISVEKDNENMDIIFKSSKKGKTSDLKKKGEFEMKLMEIDQEGIEIPDTEYPCEVTIKSSEFQKIIKDMSSLGDNCSIKILENGVRFSVSGDIGNAEISLDHDDNFCTIKKCSEEIECSFAIRYLSEFTKATALSDTVTLKLSKDFPMVVSYEIIGSVINEIENNEDDEENETETTNETVGCLEFYLAPKSLDDD